MRLSIVIPCRNGDVPIPTLDSLQHQNYQDYTVIIQPDYELRGACWARNEGFKAVTTELVLFCDDDIRWEWNGIQSMITALDAHPEASYSYGSYVTKTKPDGPDLLVGEQPFDVDTLRRYNYISTMSVIRVKNFTWFDEKQRRLQDWDLWLSLLDGGKVGVHCGEIIFRTVTTATGITFGSISWDEAYSSVQKKHKL